MSKASQGIRIELANRETNPVYILAYMLRQFFWFDTINSRDYIVYILAYHQGN